MFFKSVIYLYIPKSMASYTLTIIAVLSLFQRLFHLTVNVSTNFENN